MSKFKYSKQDHKNIEAINAALSEFNSTMRKTSERAVKPSDLFMSAGALVSAATKMDLMEAALLGMSEMSRTATIKVGDDREGWDEMMGQQFETCDHATAVKSFTDVVRALFMLVSVISNASAGRALSDAGVPDNVIQSLMNGDLEGAAKELSKTGHTIGVVGQDDEDATPKRGFTLN